MLLAGADFYPFLPEVGMRGVLPSSTLDAFKALQSARGSMTLFSYLYENNAFFFFDAMRHNLPQ
jgi:hypothetical protein